MKYKVGLIMIAFLLVTGCYHFHHKAGSAENVISMHDAKLEQKTAKTFEVKKDWVGMWVYGLVGKDVPVDKWIAEEIGEGKTVTNVAIDTKMSFLNGLVHMLTIGIYTPQSVKITGEYK